VKRVLRGLRREHPALISVNVPSHVSLIEITLLLDQGRNQGLWDYEEAIIHQPP
jgi:hypothetical protein